MSEKKGRHVLVHHKSDTAGRSDPDNVGNDALVETSTSFIPGEKKQRIQNKGECFLLLY